MEDLREKFDWMDIYDEIGNVLLTFKDNRNNLIKLLQEMTNLNLKIIPLTDIGLENKKTQLNDIDPFTFYSNFNRGITNDNRIAILDFLKKRWNLKSDLPKDFLGIPVMHNQNCWFFHYRKERDKDEIENLWTLFLNLKRKEDIESFFNKCIQVKGIHNKLLIGLFWIDPTHYLPFDRNTRKLLTRLKLIETDFDIITSGYKGYLNILKKITDTYKDLSFPEISYMAREGLELSKFSEINKSDSCLRQKNLILYGPPGTGKTYHTKNLAVNFINGGKKND